MKLDLNYHQNLTDQGVASLIASGDDTTKTQLRVTKAGVAYLSKTVGNSNLDDVAFCLPTFVENADYVGPAAAADLKYIKQIAKTLRANWPNPTSSYVEVF